MAPKFKRPGLLLHPSIPLGLGGVNPRTIEGKEWWDKKRREVYAANNHSCWACNTYQLDAKYHQWLEAHECYEYDYDKHVARYTETVGLCHSCHQFIHWRRLYQQSLFIRQPKKLMDILKHGLTILHTAGLDLPIAQRQAARRYHLHKELEWLAPPWTGVTSAYIAAYLSSNWVLLYKGKEYKQDGIKPHK